MIRLHRHLPWEPTTPGLVLELRALGVAIEFALTRQPRPQMRHLYFTVAGHRLAFRASGWGDRTEEELQRANAEAAQ